MGLEAAFRFVFAALLIAALSGCAHPAPPTVATSNPDMQIGLVRPQSPARALDPASFEVTLKDAHGQSIHGASVAITLSMPAMAMPDGSVALTKTKPGDYVGTGRFTMPGQWQVAIHVRIGSASTIKTVPIEVQ